MAAKGEWRGGIGFLGLKTAVSSSRTTFNVLSVYVLRNYCTCGLCAAQVPPDGESTTMPRPAVNPVRAAATKTLRQEAGRWLKAAREARGLTQAQLAEQVGLRYYTFVSQVESGMGRVPIEAQGAWAVAVGLDSADFARTLLRYYEPELHRLLFGPSEPGVKTGT
jgi:DNA-binding XRE family transcriptional regulator